MIVIVDYQMGNIGSISNMLRRLGHVSLTTSAPAEIRKATKLILPGVGAFDTGMRQLADSGLLPVLDEMVLKRKIPVLGICLGMQLLSRRSEEGALAGLGWIAADTVRFRFGSKTPGLKIPHMGWNVVQPTRPDPLFPIQEDERRFYFVHSYHVVCDDPADELGHTTYGYRFTSMVRRGHVCGTQFHPEKSHRFGMQLLKNFVLPASC